MRLQHFAILEISSIIQRILNVNTTLMSGDYLNHYLNHGAF